MRLTKRELYELIDMAENEGIGGLTNQPENIAGKRAFDALVRAGLAKPMKEKYDFKITASGRRAVARACNAASVFMVAGDYAEQLEEIGALLVRARVLTAEEIGRHGVRFALKHKLEPKPKTQRRKRARP